MKKIKAFTLGELLIVLAALGFIAMMIVPSIQSVRPDDSLLKFKKAYYNLHKITNAVVNSENYELGDLADPRNIGTSTAARMFCVNFSQLLNVRTVNCTVTAAPTSFVLEGGMGDERASNIGNLDGLCANYPNPPKFITQDGVVWWGFNYGFTVPSNNPNNGQRADYAVVCMDIDGQIFDSENNDVSVPAFAFGIRNDGKIIMGERAQNALREGATKIITTQQEQQDLWGRGD